VIATDVELIGRTVRADVYRPDGTPRGTRGARRHGFLRSRTTMAGHATALARDGALVIVPDLPSWTDSRENGRALVELVARAHAGAFGAPIERVMLVGFSAGGLAALLAAASPGVVAYVASTRSIVPAASDWRRRGRCARRPFWCAGRRRSATPTTSRRLERGAAGARGRSARSPARAHCDFEAPTDRWCTLLCGATDPARQQAVRDALRFAVERFLPSAPN